MIRYKIQRYSPGRKEWIDFDNIFDKKKDADERKLILRVQHRGQGLKFKVVKVEEE